MPVRQRRIRARVFVAAEGHSESAFCAWLQDLCDEQGLPVHLDRPVRMEWGGDPLALVKCALKRRRESQARAGAGHRHSCLLLDTDLLEDGSARSQQAMKLAEAQQLLMVRQVPCFEGVMLRLHRGHENDFPHSAHEAEHQLRRSWPEYKKPMTRYQLAARFALADLQRLAQVDAEIRRLMQILGPPQLR